MIHDGRGSLGPQDGFRQGLGRLRGYRVEDTANRIPIAVEPWFTESDRPNAVPGLLLDFRKVGHRIIFERFAGCDGTEEQLLNLEAAHDVLPSGMDYICL